MKVLLVNNVCNIGGIETFMVSLAQGINKKGHECELFFFDQGPMALEIPEGCPTHFGNLSNLLELVFSRNFDIVHGQSSNWYQGISAVRGIGARLVITSHHDGLVPVWQSVNCDSFVGCSRWLAEAQQAVTDLLVYTVYNGIDTNHFRPSKETNLSGSSPIVAWVGRGTDIRAKRIDKLAAISDLLCRAGLRIWLAEPHGFKELEAVAPEAARTLRRSAEVWQRISPEKMPTFFREVAKSGGCILSTSFCEGLGLALIEAQACGCPAIGLDAPGVNEVIRPAHGGTLFPFHAPPAELAETVINVLRGKDRMLWRRKACVPFIHEHFSVERMVEGYLKIYREALNEKRRKTFKTNILFLLAPITQWRQYVETRWSTGQLQYETSCNLAEGGHWKLAVAAARASAITCPTQYLKPKKLAHLLKIVARSNNA